MYNFVCGIKMEQTSATKLHLNQLYQFSSQWAVTNCCLIIYLTNRLYVLSNAFSSTTSHLWVTIELSNQSYNYYWALQSASCILQLCSSRQLLGDVRGADRADLYSLVSTLSWELQDEKWKICITDKQKKERWEVVCSNILNYFNSLLPTIDSRFSTLNIQMDLVQDISNPVGEGSILIYLPTCRRELR